VIRCDAEFDVMMLFESDAIECLYLFWNVWAGFRKWSEF
jgi:hypothetical protein